ncbi:Ger(x)C family spore germination protein [Cytobacillus horneckiae]|uniref:Ger(X)C family spore germination protein n=1 Tax=Cytobacillus horneckiae TaxID=549687 RepID=A0A2N0ZAN3_9BACI|nr:Ger(x)C family spore germination protein [Cytobacillus horneckiae]MEC1157436.1 Ger(x)C family spore germination protein [Cytobacillus horneckiae]MED2938061.1 Ger(x)C family spore germination protein [Cytobacillus horneckiae]PKG26571.1 Ger(x)C family spore germination protein [Cytobacillus horneckiae]
MKRILLIIIISSQIFFLTGCWGAKELQSQTYITAIGLDYAEGEFTVYIQALNFVNIGKQEGASALQEASPIFIGEGKGKNIQSALSKLEQKVALPLYYGHIETVLLSENVIKEQMKSVIEFIGQNSLLRYNIWLFGTEQDIKEILTSESFFNFPSLYTIIHDPKSLTKNNFFIPIEQYNKFISTYYQAVGTQLIPSLDVNKASFSEDKKKKNIAVITGGFVTSQQQYKGWADKKDLSGLKWLSKKATNIPLSLFEEKVSVIIQNPKRTIKVVNGYKPAYHLIIKANAVLVQNEEDISLDKIKKELEKKIKNELLNTMEKSEEINADLLNISENAYRYHLKEWDVSTINSIDKGSLEHIEVRIQIEQNINYKH